MASVLPTVSIGGGSSAGGGASGNPRLAGGIVLPRTTIGQVTPRETLAATARSVSRQQAQIAAYNTVLPVWYGTARQGARVVDAGVHGGRLVLFVVWGRGPHDALVQFTVNDAAPPAGVIATHYDGTQIAADPTLAAMYGGGYAEVLPGIAYSVIQVAPGEGAGWLQCAAIWRGLRLYDPRTDSVVWSPNRALWLADFVVNTIYGAARGIDKDSVIDAAEACDDPVGGQPRRSGGGLVLDTRQEIAAWLETLRTYAGCAVVDEGGLVKLIPNRPRAPVFAFRHSDGNIISMAPVRSARLADVPTVVEVQWTDTSQLPWRQRSAFAPANGLPAAGKPFRLQTVPLLGIHSESQATREAVERLNQQTLCELATEIEVFAEGARIEPGDRGNVDWPAHGFADKEFLVTATRRDGWRYKLSLLETDPAMYSDAIVAESSTPDTTLPNPSTPPAVASVTLVESLVQYDDGRIESVIDATWPAVEWPYPIEYLVELIDGAKTLPITRTRNLRARTPALVEGRTYTVRVAVVGSGIYAGAYASASLAVQGKLLLPANIASLTGFEIGGEVRLTIGPSFDKDLKGLEVRYGPLGVAWADAKFVDFVPAASGVGGRVVYGDAPEGTWEFLACGRDSIGQYSPVPARLTLDVTLDLRAFLVGNHDYTNPTPTGMREYHLPGDPTRYWVTDDFVPAATRFPAATADVYTDIAATYHAPQTSELLSEAWDVGIDAAGSWAGEIASEAISGAKTDYIALSPTGAGGSYVEQSGLTAKANARFGKVGARATGAATLKVALPALKLRVDAIPRSESFNVTTVASGPTVLNLSHGCAKFKGLSFEPIGPSACAARWNNPIVGDTPSIELYTLDLAGNQAAYTGIAKVETV